MWATTPTSSRRAISHQTVIFIYFQVYILISDLTLLSAHQCDWYQDIFAVEWAVSPSIAHSLAFSSGFWNVLFTASGSLSIFSDVALRRAYVAVGGQKYF